MAYSWEFKLAAVKAYRYISNLRKVSSIFSVAISTLSRWNFAFKQNRLHLKNSRPSKITSVLVAFIKESLINNPFMTRIKLKNMIQDVFKISVSHTLVGMIIYKSGFTRKKTRSRPCKTMSKENYEEFLSRFTEARRLKKRIVSIDETGFDDTCLPRMGYSPKGSRLVIKHSRISWKRTSVVAAVCSSGQCTHLISETPVNSDIFMEFLESLDLPPESILLMDNVAFHKTKRVREIIASRQWDILYIPPYSPWFNPIENIFSIAKNAYRITNSQNITTERSSSSSRRQMVQRAFATTTPEVITACFKHVDDICNNEISGGTRV